MRCNSRTSSWIVQHHLVYRYHFIIIFHHFIYSKENYFCFCCIWSSLQLYINLCRMPGWILDTTNIQFDFWKFFLYLCIWNIYTVWYLRQWDDKKVPCNSDKTWFMSHKQYANNLILEIPYITSGRFDHEWWFPLVHRSGRP